MTIQQRIDYEQAKANELFGTAMGSEHQQLADWLNELKGYRERPDLSEKECDVYNL